ncbi:MAG: Na+/H+ antiporter subunit E [Spirochaetales bacterium]|nr:Na+/H+ antiporter subunit E [Spirochaetales bacterium]
MKIKAAVISVVLGLLFWLGLNTSLENEVLIIGAAVVVLTAVFAVSNPVLKDLKLGPKALAAMIAWLFVFLVELIKSNIDVMFRVISPRVRINPAIVEVKTALKSPAGRMALANSITLTPGTLTVDLVDDKLFIHWIDASSTDVEEATKAIAAKFEKYLEVFLG